MAHPRIRVDNLSKTGRRRTCTSCGDPAVREYTIGIGDSRTFALCAYCDDKLPDARRMVKDHGHETYDWRPTKQIHTP